MKRYVKKSNPKIMTDLAIEISEVLKLEKDDSYDIPGVEIKQKHFEEEDMTVTKVTILNEDGAENMGKEIGQYITIESKSLKENNPDYHETIISILAETISSLLPEKKGDKLNVLVIGLGNRFATPDTLGPKVSNQVFVTRHVAVKAPDLLEESMSYLSSFAPSVMGLTGIETAEIIQGVVQNVKPDCIIAVDALAARSAARINTTIQVTDTGISPGAGVGNKRKELKQEIMGCKVIAVGIPTVVDTTTLVSDALKELVSHMLKHAEHSPFYDMLKELSEEEHYELVKESIYPELSELFVTPKEMDEVMEYLASIVSNGINLAVHKGMTLKDINKYTY